MKKLMAANWKMYKTVADGASTAAELVGLLDGRLPADREVLVCPSFTMLSAVAPILSKGTGCSAGAQNFYQRLGFRQDGIRPGYYPDTGEDALIMTRKLD